MSVTRPRGRLPARVYWTRRVLVLGVAFGLVFAISRLLGGGSDGAPRPSAQPAAVETSAKPTAVSTADARALDARQAEGKRSRVRVPLATPTGPCQDSDVRVVPDLRDPAYAGGVVHLTLALSTVDSPACNWDVSASAVAVRLSSGIDRIWSSQECPGSVPREPVVLRNVRKTLVDVTWSGRQSDAECSRSTQWAEPGSYEIMAAAMGADPETQRFRLLPPAPVTITPTPTPTPSPTATGTAAQGSHSGKPD